MTCRHGNEGKGYCKWCIKVYDSKDYFRDYEVLTYYWVQIRNKITGERFQKVGITAKTANGRFKAVKDVEVKVMYEVAMLTNQAIHTEAWVLHKLEEANRLYIPKMSISGWTECFI